MYFLGNVKIAYLLAAADEVGLSHYGKEIIRILRLFTQAYIVDL